MTKQLDCITPRGKRYIQHQNDCIARFSVAKDIQIFTTLGQATADVDGIAIKDGNVIAVLEVKSREMDLAQLRQWGNYLITHEKLVKLSKVARALTVPGFLVVSLLRDKQIVYWRLCGRDGVLSVPLTRAITPTQATCNGGIAHRENAYLSLETMQVLVEP